MSERLKGRHPTQPGPQPVKNPRYAPNQVQTEIQGGGAPPGENGVDAIATTAGKYKKNLKATIGSRWTFFVYDPKYASMVSAGQTTLSVAMNQVGTTWGLIRAEQQRLVVERHRSELAERNQDHELAQPLSGFLFSHKFSDAFRDWYLLPMAAAVWSVPLSAVRILTGHHSPSKMVSVEV